ncbi:M55 family metallopeptidase [Halarsenatibacter silvermanii]|uniref:D-aminopeptidase DppA. Metallo peptidase. MEROPS family M55 n=1 Tax=Halarsenatibacter silvermanii TaxID=321763 RepID=A0A1G9IQ19_9FIRM|nr:M55 family metallopeptidase [Halarsenatibacter silvermanii]SDL27252.1 D-aminopeptidase DppA. Metallo peptidase. MEROPS family M55 [Halarsenatibacter silvermanii]
MMDNISVYISVDMEGVAPVTDKKEVERGNPEFEKACQFMTEEANAAVRGAFAGGAERIVVRDAHESARNLNPEKLDSRAELIRGLSGKPCGMMDGLDESFDLAFFVGYHAGPDSRDAVISHAYSHRFNAISINGHAVNEAILNSLWARNLKVEPALITGDVKACKQTKNLLPDIETVFVKKGLGEAVHSLSPDKACQLIESQAEEILNRKTSRENVSLSTPHDLQPVFARLENAIRAANCSEAKIEDARTVNFSRENKEILQNQPLTGRIHSKLALKSKGDRSCLQKNYLLPGIETASKKIRLSPPYDLQLVFSGKEDAIKAANYPGVVREDAYTVIFPAEDINELMTFISFVS